MNQLLEKFLDFRSIVKYQFEYEFDNGECINFKFKQSDFPHLIGLHKLTDIPIINRFNDKNNITVSASYILGKIRQQKFLTEDTIKSSKFFDEISERFYNFSKNNLLSLTYTDVVVDFDPTLINSRLTAKYILFEIKGKTSYNHLCVAEKSKGKYYVESFFNNHSNLYIHNQHILKVKKVRIIDEYDKIYIEDENNI